MDFLQIKQVSSNYLFTKIHFYFISLIFELTGLGLKFREPQGALSKILQTQSTVQVDGGFYFKGT